MTQLPMFSNATVTRWPWKEVEAAFYFYCDGETPEEGSLAHVSLLQKYSIPDDGSEDSDWLLSQKAGYDAKQGEAIMLLEDLPHGWSADEIEAALNS